MTLLLPSSLLLSKNTLWWLFMVPSLYGLILGQGVKDAQSRAFAWHLPGIRRKVVAFILFSGLVMSLVTILLSSVEVAFFPALLLCFTIYIIAASLKNQPVYSG